MNRLVYSRSLIWMPRKGVGWDEWMIYCQLLQLRIKVPYSIKNTKTVLKRWKSFFEIRCLLAVCACGWLLEQWVVEEKSKGQVKINWMLAKMRSRLESLALYHLIDELLMSKQKRLDGSGAYSLALFFFFRESWLNPMLYRTPYMLMLIYRIVANSFMLNRMIL